MNCLYLRIHSVNFRSGAQMIGDEERSEIGRCFAPLQGLIF